MGEEVTDLWQEIWSECADEAKTRSPEYGTEDYYRSGRASKAHPNKEDFGWWQENGPRYVKLWEAWRDNCGLELAEVPAIDTGELIPGIELEAWADGPDGTCVKSATDRVFTDGTDYYIVDLKTGSRTQPWPLQLALNRLCLEQTFGIHVKYAGYWSARKGGIDPDWHDLERFTDEILWEWVWKAREIRDRQLFVPQPNMLCSSACGVKDYCVAMGGTLFFDRGATVTQDGSSDNPATPNREKEN